MTNFFGVLSGIVGVIAFVPYVQGMLRGTTRPERISWLIWTLEYVALFMAQLIGGATSSLWLVGFELVGTAGIYLLSSRYGTGVIDDRSIGMLVCVCAALVLWALTNNASLGLVLVLAIDIAALVPTVNKVYGQPHSESLVSWALLALAGLLNIPAVGRGAPVILFAYPLFVIVMSVAVIEAAFFGAYMQSRSNNARSQQRREPTTRLRSR